MPRKEAAQRPAGTIGILVEAIRGQCRVRFIYHNHWRTVEPHIVGEDAKGHAALSGYQVGGGSDSGVRSGWKLFHLDEIQGSISVGDPFEQPRSDYNAADKSFARVWAQV